MPTRRQREQRTTAARRDLTLQALQLRASGATYRQIGDALGIDKQTAWRLVQEEAAQIAQETAREVLALELARLDRLQMGVWGDAISGDHKAIEVVLRIMEQRARLLGLHDQAEGTRVPSGGYPSQAVIISADSTSSEYINALRAIRGELPLPPSNGNGNGNSSPD
jgi:hypothetical protein